LEKPKELVITIGGLHGTGKTTYAKALAKIFNLRHFSAGEAFRRLAQESGITIQELARKALKDRSIDERIDGMVKEEASKGGVIIDGLLSAWMAEDKAHVKIYLWASDKVRFKRIAERDGISLREAEKTTIEREKAEKERYIKYYGINLEDLSVYDIILNTELLPVRSIVKILENIIREYIKVKAR
jgi:cytidylate kinase